MYGIDFEGIVTIVFDAGLRTIQANRRTPGGIRLFAISMRFVFLLIIQGVAPMKKRLSLAA